jgi:transcriptional regulator with XRE-family HTH domain
MNPLTEPSIEDIAASLRAIRKQKGMTLKDVEIASNGRWKAVVIGSYERCDRALSLKKAINLAAFYQMPLDQLLGLENRESAPMNRKITLDLRRVRERSTTGNNFQFLATFTNLLCAKRRDWNGEVLSLRDTDLTTLALLLTLDESATLEWLNSEKLILLKN